jgi:hypothetical protein
VKLNCCFGGNELKCVAAETISTRHNIKRGQSFRPCDWTSKLISYVPVGGGRSEITATDDDGSLQNEELSDDLSEGSFITASATYLAENKYN